MKKLSFVEKKSDLYFRGTILFPDFQPSNKSCSHSIISESLKKKKRYLQKKHSTASDFLKNIKVDPLKCPDDNNSVFLSHEPSSDHRV